MKYEIINEELKIAACRISDLTLDLVQGFLYQWEDGASIGTLTLFFDKVSNMLVLNRDNKHYPFYLELAETYLREDTDRPKLREKAPEGLEETLDVLEACLRFRTIGHEIDLALKNKIDSKDRTVVEGIANCSDGRHVASAIAFRYGVMCGKREERARRKKALGHE